MSPPLTLPLIPLPGWLAAFQAVAPVGPHGGPGNPLSAAEAGQVFHDLAAQPQIPFNWPRDGCYARAHEMGRIMAEKGIESRKVWNYGHLHVDGTSMGTVTWGYHVAPIVSVKGSDGVTRDMVMDPSMFDHPVPVAEWTGAQHDPSSTTETSPRDVFYRDQGVPENDPRCVKDDDYSRTQHALEQFRMKRELWDAGIGVDTP
jgi:hypothetical protein